MKGAEEGLQLPPTTGHSEDPPPPLPSPTPEEALEDFQDAVETLKPQDDGIEQATVEDTAEGVAGGGTSGVRNVAGTPASEQTGSVETSASTLVAGKVTAIAPGLANVRLPMGFGAQSHQGVGSIGRPVDSDGEEEFHDAQDSGPGVVKNAVKAREMKETGNQ